MTQRQLDKISFAASDIKESVNSQLQRLNGGGIYVGEENTDVFALMDKLKPAPKFLQAKLRKALIQASDALQMAEMYAEELEQWADDEEPT
jgi:hypothetical protein